MTLLVGMVEQSQVGQADLEGAPHLLVSLAPSIQDDPETGTGLISIELRRLSKALLPHSVLPTAPRGRSGGSEPSGRQSDRADPGAGTEDRRLGCGPGRAPPQLLLLGKFLNLCVPQPSHL